MHAAGGVRSRVELLQAIFGDDASAIRAASTSTCITSATSWPRQGATRTGIVTVRGAGYRLGR